MELHKGVRLVVRGLIVGVGVAAFAGCGSVSDEGAAVVSDEQAVVTATAAGNVPAALPKRVMLGLFEDHGGTWMSSSGVRWDARYRYFTKGWVNNWGWSNYDGSWGRSYLDDCNTRGYVPAIAYYQMHGEPGGGESSFYAKTTNATTMKSYFGDFKILMQRIKDSGKPAMVLLEADGFGLLEQQTNNNPQAYAAVADTGLPELAGLPNTVAGWGLAFLKLKQSVGASSAVLGVHISAWASGKDVSHFSVTDPLSPEVDKVYNFLAPMGLSSNVTGATWDVLVGDPLDRDADYYRVKQGQDRWWDPADTASISSKSFNRYAEWLRLWNVRSSKRWVLWQIPLGNSNSANVGNTSARGGYKDNRTEYFFGTASLAHVAKFANSGVIAMLFGAGAGEQASYQYDQAADGQLFMKSRANSNYYALGGVSLASGTTTTDAGVTPPVDSGVTDSRPTETAVSDPAKYGFENGVQGFAASTGTGITGVSSSSTRAYAGTKSLALQFSGASSGVQRVSVASPSVAAGSTVVFRVWVPAGMPLSSIQPFALQGATGNWAWTGTWTVGSSVTTGSWKTLALTLPANSAPLYQLGVEFTLSAAWTGTAYVDSINW